MVNLRDPAVQDKEFESFKLLMHMLLGAYIWDYVKHIKFDIELLRRNEGRTQWAKYTYLICRNVVLVHTALEFAFYGYPTKNSCETISSYQNVALSHCLSVYRYPHYSSDSGW